MGGEAGYALKISYDLKPLCRHQQG